MLLIYSGIRIMTTLQRHCTENSKQIFPEMKLRGLVPNSYIHVTVSDLYIPRISKIGGNPAEWSWEYINPLQIKECGNWERGHAVSFLGIHKSDLLWSVYKKRPDDCMSYIFQGDGSNGILLHCVRGQSQGNRPIYFLTFFLILRCPFYGEFRQKDH